MTNIAQDNLNINIFFFADDLFHFFLLGGEIQKVNKFLKEKREILKESIKIFSLHFPQMKI